MEQNAPPRLLRDILGNIERVIAGKTAVIEQVLICLVCGGHVLIEDVPGLGKTTLVQALAQSVSAGFGRIQFTPDVTPGDVTGFYMYAPGAEAVFHPGAVMCQILLADEINRTSPKTQSALLQAMQEGRVSVDGVTHPLPRPFMVCATQNPVELTGTYPLPEAQLDRFLMRVSMGYPTHGEELEILRLNEGAAPAVLQPVATADEVLALQAQLEQITCAAPVMDYIVQLARATRAHEDVALGASPRGSIALMRAARGHALLRGRGFVLPDDVQAVCGAVLCHRLVLQPQAQMQGKTAAGLVEGILKKTTPPAAQPPAGA